MEVNRNNSFYEIAQYSAVSLVPQITVVFFEFLGMLAITNGMPSRKHIELTFCLSITTIAWLQWRRNIFFNSPKYIQARNRKSQLRLLKSSILEWNLWRNENLFIELDLQRANLGKANLSGANLSSANHRKANLHKANLARANLTGVERRGIHQEDRRRTNRPGTDRRRTNLNSANLRKANLSGANLTDANLSGADLINADLRNADLVGTDLRGADLTEAKLRGADLTEAVFDNKTNVTNCQFGNGIGLAESTKADLRRRGGIFKGILPAPTPHTSI